MWWPLRNENERTLDDVGQTSFDVAIIDEVSKATRWNC